MNPPQKQLIEQTIAGAIETHFESRRTAVDDFVKRKYRYPGCWQTNKKAFGLDLLRSPFNLLWAPIYIVSVLILLGVSKFGVASAGSWAKRLPGGITTRVQREINAHVEEELLQPLKLETQIYEAVIALPIAGAHEAVQNDQSNHTLSSIIADTLKQLMLTRTASADITNTLVSTATGALLFKKFTPGGFGLGVILAALWANHHATNNFFLGETIGSWYYSVFPVKPALSTTILSVIIIMICLAVVASFSGLISDPIQAHTGLHKRRLLKLLNQVEQDLLDKVQSRYKPLDPYIARILEFFDAIKSQVNL